MRTSKITLKVDEINLLFAGSISAILTNSVYWLSGHTVSLWISLLFFLMAYPWKIFGATFSLFGGASEQGNIYSLISFFQVTKNGSCESVFGLNLFSSAHKNIFCLAGFNIFSKAGENIACFFGLNLFSKASNIFAIVGVNLFSSSDDDIFCLIGLNAFSFAFEDIYVVCGFNLFLKSYEDVQCVFVGANIFSEARRNVACLIGMNLFTKAETSSVLGFGVSLYQKAPVFSGISFSLAKTAILRK